MTTLDLFRPVPRAGEVAGVQITCEGERNRGYFLPVSVPLTDAIFTTATVCPVSVKIGTPLLIRQVGPPEGGRKITGSLENQAAASFLVDPISGNVPQSTDMGTILFVRQDKKPLAAKHLESMWMFHDRLLTTFRFADNAPAAAKLLMTPEKWAFYWTNYSRNQESLLRQLGQRNGEADGWANVQNPFEL